VDAINKLQTVGPSARLLGSGAIATIQVQVGKAVPCAREPAVDEAREIGIRDPPEFPQAVALDTVVAANLENPVCWDAHECDAGENNCVLPAADIGTPVLAKNSIVGAAVIAVQEVNVDGRDRGGQSKEEDLGEHGIELR